MPLFLDKHKFSSREHRGHTSPERDSFRENQRGKWDWNLAEFISSWKRVQVDSKLKYINEAREIKSKQSSSGLK